MLAILADRWQNAEHYRDCFEFLARAISVSQHERLGYLEKEARQELGVLAKAVADAGINQHVSVMLAEIVSQSDSEAMEL